MPPRITNNTLKHRFETEVGAKTAFLNYRVNGDSMVLTHTEVPPAIEGRGIGTALVRTALDYARQHNFRVDPQCPFVAEFIKSNPQYQALVAR